LLAHRQLTCIDDGFHIHHNVAAAAAAVDKYILPKDADNPDPTQYLPKRKWTQI